MLKVFKKIWDFADNEQKNIRKSIILAFFNALFFSVQFGAIFVVLNALVEQTTDKYVAGIALGLMLLSVVVRIVTQTFSQLDRVHAGYFMVANKRIFIGDKIKNVPMGWFNDNKRRLNMPTLTVAMQNYIRAIFELSSDGEGVRISDIAVKRKVSKSSACIAMKTLQKEGLIQRDNDRLVILTVCGKEQAMVITNKFAIIQQFLRDKLGISRENATLDACAMEHSISIETLCSFCRSQNFQRPQQECEGGCYVALYDAKSKPK